MKVRHLLCDGDIQHFQGSGAEFGNYKCIESSANPVPVPLRREEFIEFSFSLTVSEAEIILASIGLLLATAWGAKVLINLLQRSWRDS